jgi:undecaprenyl diphosphate synthase
MARAARWEALPPPLPASAMPRHIAIIMDGNGRWARQRGFVRVAGHRAGVDSVRDITRYCGQIRIAALTLYAFSTENWKRPKAEIRFLFRMLKRFLAEERAELMANQVRLTTIGRIDALPEDVQDELERSRRLSECNQGLNLCLALNYGAHDEILSAAQRLARSSAAGELNPEEITEELFERTLDTAGMPPLDLLIRTAGERRLSNFLLWQACGAEFHVTPVCWPEFRRQHLDEAIREFARRRRVPRTEDAGVSGAGDRR